MLQKIFSDHDSFDKDLTALLQRSKTQHDEAYNIVKEIIDNVRLNKDDAVLHYTRQFDKIDVQSVSELELNRQSLAKAYDDIDKQFRLALEQAAQRIRYYHQQQKSHGLDKDWSYQQEDGSILGQKISAMDKVGIYVPGGKAAYPSSVLMSAITAKVAGVKEVIMVVPTPDAQINSYVLAAAYIAGVDRVFTIGGAQAIAALAYGTQTIPSVDKIVGPGNIFVSTAKQLVYGQVGIDMIAGPSEVLIVCDDSVDSDWVAMDLFAQAEHDEQAQSILLSSDKAMIDKVEQSIAKLLPTMPRKDIIQASLRNNGALIYAEPHMLADICNQVAPEHLQIMTKNADDLISQIKHAGAIFVGRFSAESLGDYCAGPSHVLPTSGTAKFSSPLGVYDFQKRSSIIHMTEKGAKEIAPIAEIIADLEGLIAHRDSAKYRT